MLITFVRHPNRACFFSDSVVSRFFSGSFFICTPFLSVVVFCEPDFFHRPISFFFSCFLWDRLFPFSTCLLFHPIFQCVTSFFCSLFSISFCLIRTPQPQPGQTLGLLSHQSTSRTFPPSSDCKNQFPTPTSSFSL